MSSSTVAYVRLCGQGHVDGHQAEQRIFFDDATRLILVPRENKVEAYDLPTEDNFNPHLNRKCWEVHVEHLDQFQSIQISLDAKTLAIHRSSKLIEFVDRETGNIFVQGCSKPKHEILGVYFVESKSFDLVMITDSATEFYKFTNEKREGLKMEDRHRQTIKWCTYTFPTRVLLLGVGLNGARICGYQFTTTQTIKLPSVDLEPSPLSDSETLMEAANRPKRTNSVAPLLPEDIVLLRLYNRVFFCHIDRKKRVLRFYRVFMDILMFTREYEMSNDALHFNVVDNVLLVHHTNSSVVAVFDLASPTELPIGSPLPVSAEMFTTSGKSRMSSPDDANSSNVGTQSSPARLQNVKSFNPEWRFFQPDVVLDDNGNIYRLQLDLEGIIASYSDPSLLIGFLNRRRIAWTPSANPHVLLVSTLRNIIHQRHSVQTMKEVFDMLHYDGSEDVVPAKSERITPAALKLQTPMLKTQDVIDEVFKYLISEGVVSLEHLESALIEFMKSADEKKRPLDASVYICWAELMLQQKHYFQLQQLVQNLSEAQSVEFAEHLDGLNLTGMCRELGINTFARCAVSEKRLKESKAMHQYCQALLRHGKIIKALRVAQRHRVTSLTADQFTQAAQETMNENVITTVKRFINEQNIL
eukprot:g921.t1